MKSNIGKYKNLVFYILFILGLFCYYSVELKSGLYSDDIINSCFRGSVAEEGTTPWALSCKIIMDWAKNGRIFPVSFILTYYFFYYFYANIIYYKIVIIITTIIDILLFGKILEIWTGRIEYGRMGMILAGLFMPVYSFGFVNPLNTFGFMMQPTMLFGFLSIYFILLHLRNGKKRDNWISAIFSVFAIYTYEPGYIFPVIIGIIIIQKGKGIKEIIKNGMPHAILSWSNIVFNLVWRYLHSDQIYSGAKPNINMGRILPAFYHQLSGNVPFGAWAVYNLNLPFDNKMDAYVNMDLMTAIGVIAILLIIVINWYGLNKNKKISSNPSNLASIIISMLLLFFVPSVLISISSRYQNEVITAGPWLPVFMGIFGSAGICLMIVIIMNKNRYINGIINIGLMISALIIVPIYSYSAKLQFKNEKSEFKDARNLLYNAAIDGVLYEAYNCKSERAKIILDNKATPMVYHSLFSCINENVLTANLYGEMDKEWIAESKDAESDSAGMINIASDNNYIIKENLEDKYSIVGKIKTVEYNNNLAEIEHIIVNNVRIYSESEIDTYKWYAVINNKYCSLSAVSKIKTKNGYLYIMSDKDLDFNSIFIRQNYLGNGDSIDFGYEGYNAERYIANGLSGRKHEYAWTEGRKFEMNYQMRDIGSGKKVHAKFDIESIFNGSQRIVCILNSKIIMDKVVNSGENIEFDYIAPEDGFINIKMIFPDAKSPKDLWGSADDRILGVTLRKYTINICD